MLSLLFAALLPFYHVQVPAAAMHQAPDQESNVLSEALFAEQVTLLETQDDWVKIQTEDNCEGWIKNDAIVGRETSYANCTCVVPIVEVISLFANVHESKEGGAPLFTIPFESRLEAPELAEEEESPWLSIRLPQGSCAFILKEHVTADIHAISKAELPAFSKHFLDLPYTPAGRSSFGFDSAGFVQLLYKQIGYQLPRSVQEQSDWESLEAISLDALEPGDLIFWGDSAQSIEHVGLYIGDQQFIHSSPNRVSISNLESPLKWPFRVMKKLK
jgi:hypothetical protein